MKNRNSSIAVILAYYNGEKYIKEQVNSILEQTLKDIFIYISDDKSQNKLKKINLSLSKENLIRVSIFNRKKNI